jgi:hypothetical protein
MSLAARITRADDFSAPDGKSHELRASSDGYVPSLADGCGPSAATAILAASEGLFREPANHGNRWRNPVAVGAFLLGQLIAQP